MLYYELLMAIGHAVRQHCRELYQQLVDQDDPVVTGNALSMLMSADDWMDELIVRKIQMDWAKTSEGVQ